MNKPITITLTQYNAIKSDIEKAQKQYQNLRLGDPYCKYVDGKISGLEEAILILCTHIGEEDERP